MMGLKGLSVGLSLTVAAAAVAASPASPSDARKVVEAYLKAHNAHDVAAVMTLYAPDAVFRLSGGRGVSRGRNQIRELVLFDVVAGSQLDPQDISFHRENGQTRVAIRTVIERSRVFTALGLDPVTTLSERAAFVIRGKRIVEANQPLIKESCRQVAMAGMSAFIGWLDANADPRKERLTTDGRPKLNAATIPTWVAALNEWRERTKWSPEDALRLDCARID